MRTLTIADNWKDWKFGDTDAVMTFTALDDNKVPDFSNRTLTFKIASTLNNDLEHPKDFAATATGYIQGKDVILKTEDVKQLTPGNYIVELWAMSNDTQKDAVYPSKGFAQFTIEENSMKVSDVTNIPSMTINAFWNAVMQKVRTLTKGAKGDPGKTPKIVMGSVTKLSPDAQPSATLVPLQSDPNTYTLNLQLPQGVQGEQGLQGIPGVGSKGLDGTNGLTPTIDPKTKHWMIGGADTGVIAEGQAGKDADPSKYVTIASFNQLQQKDAQQDAIIANKADRYELEDKLAQMSLEPEAFENETALKAKYPAGASGLMVTVDTGHKWLWINGAWKDCGVYQGKGIANRSVDSLAIKERTLALRTSQSTPWIVDLQNHKLTVSDYSYIYDDTAYQIPKGDYLLSDFTTVYLGYDAVKEQLNSYQHYTDIPESSYYVGAVDFGSRKAFLGFDWVAANKTPNGKVAFSSKIDREHLPAPITGMVSLLPWTVNTYGDTPTITVNGYTHYLTKGSSFSVQTGTYQLDKIDGGGYYLYLDLDYDKLTAAIKATSHPDDIPINDPWIGFVETNSHVYRIFDNSDNLSYNFDLVTPGKFTVNFDKGILYVPVFWQTVNPLKVWSANDSVAEIKFDKSQGALFVGIDPSQSDVQKMIVLDSNRQKIQDTYQYIGWISINTQEYDFGKYGSTRDLATQPWIDKKVACLGDSITEGDSGEGSLIDSYVPKLKKYIGTTAQNFGKSGALITKKTDDDISFVNRVGAIKGQDVVTIFGGINDFQWNAPLGTMADGADKPTTFYGALKYVITTLSANNPKAKLMLITPMKTTKFQYHTYDSNGNLMQNANGNTQLDFVNAIKQVGEYYSIPVLDMYSNSNYSPYLPSQVGHDNFTADGLHPTAHGYERIARTIGHAINNL